MSLSPALTTGSGTRTGTGVGGEGAATRLEFGEEKRLKSGKENQSTLGNENWLKSGREKPPKPGKELAVAAPMTASAARDTAITGTRLKATCGAASGCLSPCVSLSRVSVTCVPYVSAQPLPIAGQQNKRAIAATNRPWLARACPPEFGSNHRLVWLMIGYSRDQPIPVPVGAKSI